MRGDESPLPHASHTSVINNVLHSLFKEISLELNSKSVTDRKRAVSLSRLFGKSFELFK